MLGRGTVRRSRVGRQGVMNTGTVDAEDNEYKAMRLVNLKM